MATRFVALIGVVAVVLTPVALGAAGFTSAGTLAGSIAASMMSTGVSSKGEEFWWRSGGVLPSCLIKKACHHIASTMSDAAFDELGGMSGCQKAVTAVLIGGGAAGAVVLAPAVLASIGFTSTGITAGSYAASLMSAFATANGGGVAAGGVVAGLQAAGAAGLSGAATAVVAATGAATGAVMGWLTSCES